MVIKFFEVDYSYTCQEPSYSPDTSRYFRWRHLRFKSSHFVKHNKRFTNKIMDIEISVYIYMIFKSNGSFVGTSNVF